MVGETQNLGQVICAFIKMKYPAFANELGYAIDVTLGAEMQKILNGSIDSDTLTNRVMDGITPLIPQEVFEIAYENITTEAEIQIATQQVINAIRQSIKADIGYLMTDYRKNFRAYGMG